MKAVFYFPVLLVFAGVLTGCASGQGEALSMGGIESEEQRAREALVNFLENLHSGKYGEAALLYGGTYKTMIANNPNIAPGDSAGLLRNACTVNGIQCLRVKSAKLNRKASENEFVFDVEFLNSDGTLFVLGLCCGEDATDVTPQSVFPMTVMKVEPGKFVVIDLPPYVP